MFGINDYLNSDPIFYDPEVEPWKSNDDLMEHNQLSFPGLDNLQWSYNDQSMTLPTDNTSSAVVSPNEMRLQTHSTDSDATGGDNAIPNQSANMY